MTNDNDTGASPHHDRRNKSEGSIQAFDLLRGKPASSHPNDNYTQQIYRVPTRPIAAPLFGRFYGATESIVSYHRTIVGSG